MNTFIQKYKNKIAISIGVLFSIGTTAGIYSLISKNNNNDNPKKNYTQNLNYQLAKELMTGKSDGIVNLVSVSDSSKIEEFDLKNLLEKAIPTKKKEKEKQKPKEEPIHDIYEGFEKVSIEFKKGDTAWDIQKGLSPNKDTWQMILLLKNINEGKNLDVVYPGESRMFLKPIDTTQIQGIEKVEEEKALVKEDEEVVTDEPQLDLSGVTFMYSKSLDYQILYAYTPFENSFFKIEVADDKVKAEKIATISSLPSNIDEFKVEGNRIFARSSQKIYCISTNGDMLGTINLSGEVADWTVLDGDLFYISDENLYKISKDSFNQQVMSLGDKSKDIEIVHDDLYILNDFGTKQYKSVLQKINPKDLSVYGWQELDSNENKMYDIASDNGSVVLAQHKTENTRDNNYLVNVDLDKIKEGNNIKLDKIFDNAIVKGNIIYERVNDTVNLISTEKLKELSKVDISGDVFVPIISK